MKGEMEREVKTKGNKTKHRGRKEKKRTGKRKRGNKESGESVAVERNREIEER